MTAFLYFRMAVPTALVQSRWHRSQLAETDTSDQALTSQGDDA
jgi:hypothetical protein